MTRTEVERLFVRLQGLADGRHVLDDEELSDHATDMIQWRELSPDQFGQLQTRSSDEIEHRKRAAETAGTAEAWRRYHRWSRAVAPVIDGERTGRLRQRGSRRSAHSR